MKYTYLAIALCLSLAMAGQKPAPAAPAQTAPVLPALAIQVQLDRAGFSPGEIDGNAGANTRRALEAAKKAGKDPAADTAETLISHQITAEEVAGPFTESIPADLMQQASLPALNYTSSLEALSERFHASPTLLQKLNPGATFVAGETIKVPNVIVRELPAPAEPPAAARGRQAQPATSGRQGPPATPGRQGPPATPPNVKVVVSKSESSLTVLDDDGAVLFHAPVTSGSQHDPLPIGNWTVTAVSRNPNFHYNPDLFWDANPTHAKAKIPPGPNNPVGVVWIDISKPHYGIHGSPEPSKIGHTQSHGCVRLTNWDAAYVASLVRKGTPVEFVR